MRKKNGEPSLGEYAGSIRARMHVAGVTDIKASAFLETNKESAHVRFTCERWRSWEVRAHPGVTNLEANDFFTVVGRFGADSFEATHNILNLIEQDIDRLRPLVEGAVKFFDSKRALTPVAT